MMKKRVLSILLILCLLLSVVPTTAFAAADGITLWVGNEQFGATQSKTATIGGGTAAYVSSTNTLTLNNVTINFSESDNMPAIQNQIANLTIVLEGTNTINITKNELSAIHLMASTTIKGTSGSKLVINSVGENNEGIFTDEGVSLTMTDVNVVVNDNITDTAKKGYMKAIRANGNLTMTGGSLTATGVQSGIEMFTTNYVANLSGVNFNISCGARASFNESVPNEMSIGLNMAPLTAGKQNVISNCSGSISAHIPLYSDGATVMNNNNLTLTTSSYDAVRTSESLTISGGTLNLTSTASAGTGTGFKVTDSAKLEFNGSPNVTMNVGYVAIYLSGDGASAVVNSGMLKTTAKAGVLVSKSGGAFTLAGGTLEMNPQSGVEQSIGISTSGTVNITGGSLKTTTGLYSAIQNAGSKTVTISGGTHTLGNSAKTGAGYVDTANGTLAISGTANVMFTGWSDALNMYGTLNLSGGSLTVSDTYDGIYSTGALNFSGGTLNIDSTRVGILSGDGSQVSFAGANATVKGGTAGWGKTEGSGAYSVTGGKVVLQGGSYAAGNIYSSLAEGYRVYAGADESSAALVSSPAIGTFTGNRYVRMEAGARSYTLTLVNVKGAASATHAAGEAISYTAEDAPGNQHFLRWDLTVNGTTTSVGTSATYSGTMPAGDATLTAVYENCSGGTATCKEKARCAVCGNEYGELKAHYPTAEVVDEKYLVTAPTCTSEGVYYKSCPDCGASAKGWTDQTFTVPALDHTESGWQSDADGHWKVCTVCGVTTTVKAAHTPGAAATETTPQTCTECGYIIAPAQGHTHTMTKVEAKEPTCTTPGNTEYYVCSGCGGWFKDEAGSVQITDHSSVVVGTIAHTASSEWKYDDTNHWHECTECGTQVDAAGHTPGAAATETTPQTCTECGYVIAPALGHTHVMTKVEAKEPTCTTEGNIEYYQCSACGKLFADADGTTKLAAEDVVRGTTAHQYAWVIDKEPTSTEAGSKHEECTVCHDKKPAVEIPATGPQTDSLESRLKAGGTVVLDQDYTIDRTIKLQNTVTLDLNGHTIRMAGSGTVLTLFGGNLTLQDSSADASGMITGGNASKGGGVYITAGGSFTMNGGTIANCTATDTSDAGGGGVCIGTGSFTMNGGVIENCSAPSCLGGGVLVQSGSFTMNGGVIRGCSAKYADGVRVAAWQMTMTGGSIEDSAATAEGRTTVSLDTTANLIVDGGEIHGVVSTATGSTIANTSTGACTRFYGNFRNYGTVSGGIYYGGLQNLSSKSKVTGTYYTVSFNLNGGSGSIPTQWFVNISTATALKPADPTKDGYVFAGWYNGDTKYDFTKPVTENLTLTAKWVSTNVSTGDELKEALDAGLTSIKLLGDIKLSGTLDLTDKEITLDLNGHTLTGNIKLADTSAAPKSILTLTDSAGGGVLNGNIELTRGNYGNASYLYANGGTVTGKVSLNSYVAKIFCTSDTPTVFQGYVGNSGEIHGGIFDGSVNTKCIKENTVTFMKDGSRYALEVVADGSKVAAPVEPTVPEGSEFTGWYTDEALTTPYEFGGALSGSITLYAGIQGITHTVTYDPGEYGEGDVVTDVKAYGKELTLRGETFTREGYVQTGWSDTDGGWTTYALDDIYSAEEDLTLYPVWEEIITVTFPFTTTVTLGDVCEPGETTFDLAILKANGDKMNCGDVTVSGSVTTDGAGEYDGVLTLTGTYQQLLDMLCEGAFVQQVDAGEAGWTYDDTVWGLYLWQGVAELATDDTAATGYTVFVFPALCQKTDNGVCYEIDLDAEPLDEMYFENIYTMHEHAYEQQHNETDHWDECECGDIQNKEAHQYGEWTVTKEATETAMGEQEHTCTVCGYQETGTIPMLGHTHDYTQAHDETSHWEECDCGDIQNKEAHQYGEWTVTKEATETAMGEQEHTCAVCGYQETGTIPVLGHTHDYTQVHDETSHWEECDCGDIQNKEAHQYGEWTVTKEATETAKGKKVHTCTVCGYQETAEIAKLTTEKDSAQTGDNSNLTLWAALLLVSGSLLAVTGMHGKRSNRRRSARAK